MVFDLIEYGIFVPEEPTTVESWGYGDKWTYVGTYYWSGWEFYPAILEVWVQEGENPERAEWLDFSVYPAPGCAKVPIMEGASEYSLRGTSFSDV